MTAEEARSAFLEWLAAERGAAPPVVEAYGRDVAELIAFLMMSQGRMPDEKALAEVSQEALRAFLASRAEAGLDEAGHKRQAAAIRGFQRFLARRRAKPADEAERGET